MAISLEKGKKVNLRKQEKVGLGEILVNLNWLTFFPFSRLMAMGNASFFRRSAPAQSSTSTP